MANKLKLINTIDVCTFRLTTYWDLQPMFTGVYSLRKDFQILIAPKSVGTNPSRTLRHQRLLWNVLEVARCDNLDIMIRTPACKLTILHNWGVSCTWQSSKTVMNVSLCHCLCSWCNAEVPNDSTGTFVLVSTAKFTSTNNAPQRRGHHSCIT